MKTKFTLIACLIGTLGPGLYRAAADFEVSAGINIQSTAEFQQPLTGYGTWIQVGTFGRCWHPAVTSVWRPYCNGNWEWTDCGWYWVSDEPWAWACYHYGTWAYDPTDGWVWIPGVEWAPAWVNWRTGGGYIGWAPCGPSGATIQDDSYVFVENKNFNTHFRPDSVIVNNPSIIARTTEIKSVAHEQRVIGGRSQTVLVNNGPGVAAVEKATGRKFSPVPVQKADESAYRSASSQLKRQQTEPQKDLREQAPSQPNGRLNQRSVNETPSAIPGQNSKDVPSNVEPRKELPADKDLPAERTLPQNQPQRAVPENPGKSTVPPADKLPSGNSLQSPKETVNPKLAPRQPVPVSPAGKPAPDDNNKAGEHN